MTLVGSEIGQSGIDPTKQANAKKKKDISIGNWCPSAGSDFLYTASFISLYKSLPWIWSKSLFIFLPNKIGKNSFLWISRLLYFPWFSSFPEMICSVLLNKAYYRCCPQPQQRAGCLLLADDGDVAEFPKFQCISQQRLWWQNVLVGFSKI